VLAEHGHGWSSNRQSELRSLVADSLFPFNKVRKQLVNGSAAGDSITGFFQSVLTLQAAGKL
jgi:hypothetical protein